MNPRRQCDQRARTEHPRSRRPAIRLHLPVREAKGLHGRRRELQLCAGQSGGTRTPSSPPQSDLSAARGGPPTSTEYYAKAYPGTRELQVLKDVGEMAVVASICPKVLKSADVRLRLQPRDERHRRSHESRFAPARVSAARRVTSRLSSALSGTRCTASRAPGALPSHALRAAQNS